MAYTGKIAAGWLFDGSGGPVQKDALMAVENGMLVSVEPMGTGAVKFGQSQSEGEPDIDLSGYTVIPALIDCHVHLFMSGTSDTEFRQHQLTASYEKIRSVIERHVRQHLRHGVMAVRDGGDWAGHAHLFKHENVKTDHLAVRIMSSHKAFKSPRRYGKLIGRAPEAGESLADAIRRVLEKKGGKRPDQIKLVNSGINSLKNFGKQTLPQFEQSELSEAVKVAHHFQLPVMVHANGELPVKYAVAAGCDSIEHGFFMGRDNLKRMADSGTVWVPTACTMKGYREQLVHDGFEAKIAGKYLEHQIEQIAMARELGVSLAVGTDSGSLGVHHGAAVSEEIRLFILAGFSPSEAISRATRQGSRLMGLNRLGELCQGREATFLAFSGSPEELIQKIHAPDLVFWKGELLQNEE